MFLINTITNTVHACSSHNVSSRTLNRLVIDRTTTLTADKVIHCSGKTPVDALSCEQKLFSGTYPVRVTGTFYGCVETAC
ncbi:Uncharacterised protein [Shigella sonnei]|nr:Uncharacterised protein [Shigella sonnei]